MRNASKRKASVYMCNLQDWTRSMSGKGVKGGKGPPMGRPGAPIPGAKVVAAVPVTPVMETVKKPITFLGEHRNAHIHRSWEVSDRSEVQLKHG